MTDASKACGCAICQMQKDFAVPEDLLKALVGGELVIFAGAGISTEAKSVFPYSLYEDVLKDVGVSADDNLPFPDLMSRFCERVNGRQELLKKIRDRFSYIKSFPELRRDATRFHRQLATLHQVDTIVTTNWDEYFEEECGATPFVSGEDIAMWSVPGRKVLKIHGSISSLGSVVATKEDYEACYQRLSSGLIGSFLKTILATKTVVYVGYSMGDEDFRKIHEILSVEMRGLRPHSYVVTVDDRDKDRILDAGFTPIITDGEYFLSVLKRHLVESGQLLPDEAYEGLFSRLGELIDAHQELSSRVSLADYPAAILTACYQDGVIHALERVIALKNTGKYSCVDAARNMVFKYDKIKKERVRGKRYHDAAYIEGYQDGLLYLYMPKEDREFAPTWYVYGAQRYPKNIDDLRDMLDGAEQIHKQAYRFCKRLVSERLSYPGAVFHHTPFLL